MNLFSILFVLCLLLIVMLGKIKTGKIIYLRRLLLPLLCCAFILCLIVFSSTAVNAAAKGISLWMNIVFPSLFPFFVASELMNSTGFVKAAGVLLEPVMRPLFNVPGCGSFAFALGVTSGYPVGAKITAGMREEGLLSKPEAERLLAFSNNSGPLFIVGAVSVGMFKMPRLGLLLLACHILACITVGILFRFYGGKETRIKHTSGDRRLARFKKELLSGLKSKGSNFGSIFGDAIRNSITTILAIGGFIIFFSVIIHLLLETGFIHSISGILAPVLTPLGVHRDTVTALLSGSLEITTGTNMISKAADVPLWQQLTAAAMIIGWAGFSVHAQVLSIVSTTDISIKPYLLGKFLQGVFAALYTFVGIKAAGSAFLKAEPAFAPMPAPMFSHWYDYFMHSCEYLLVALAVIFVGIAVAAALNLFARVQRSLIKQHP